MTDLTNQPLSSLTPVQRRQLLAALEWLASYRDTDQVAELMRSDPRARRDALAGLSDEDWRELAELAMESIVLPVAIEARQSLDPPPPGG